MINCIYFDNSATTPLCPEALEKMKEAAESFGNPSSMHALGFSAEKLISQARNNILDALGARPGAYKLIFTSCGTEANNLALLGTCRAKNFKNPKIIISDSEHPCIQEPAKYLEEHGFKVVRLSTRGGKIDINELISAMDERTVLLSVMLVNNETGAVYDVKKLFSTAKKINPKVITHCDAVQGFLKVKFSPESLGVDLVTISSHKINGPKGSGALCVSQNLIKSKRILPVLLGGGQEDGFRSGTENVIGIAGFGAAAKAGAAALQEDLSKMRELRDYLKSKLTAGAKVNEPLVASPHIISITLPDIKSETMLHYLSGRGIYVSSGSACSSHGKHGSYVLAGFGLDAHASDCTIRVSLSPHNTFEEIDEFTKALDEGIANLVRIK